ncbi:MAG: hypothetical protein ACXVCD_17210 [Pseudobdellovibrionaceae bacterium]
MSTAFKDSPTFQDFNKKIEKLGFTSAAILPENSEIWTPIIDGEPISIKEAYFSSMLNKYYQSYHIYKNLEKLLKASKDPLTESEKKYVQEVKKEKAAFSNASQELKLYKQAYPNEFSKLIERVRVTVNEKGWEFTYRSLAEIRENGLEYDDPMINLLTDPNGIFADQNLKIKKISSAEVNGQSQVKPEEKFNTPIKDQGTCNLKAMSPFKSEIMKVKSGYYYGGIRDKSVLASKEPCLLLDLSFKINKNPFKRTLLGANIMDMKGEKKPFSQSDFDRVLTQWGVIKNPIPETYLSNSNKPASREGAK